MTEPTTIKKKKPIYKRVWFWAAIALVVIIGAASTGGGNTTSSSSGAPGATTGQPSQAAAPSDDPLSDGGWTATDIQARTDQYGTTYTARVTNTEGQTRSGLFTLTVFGDGKRIGNATGAANKVEAGQTATVTFIPTTDAVPGDPKAWAYELQTDY